ncbi:DMT family transporter [Sulfurospirillum sp. T05]|uniref:DMT family transporter n=1 Tax=Sulfurospirillum tamanense TaxID=2813362 RepID=A0ABS2WTF9_9BACT|nr:DMT family transporter [Sulfurospirillum tamanensis]
MEKLREFGADFSLLLVAIAWGLTFVPVQQAVEETPVYVFLFWRFLCATLLMALLAAKNLRVLDRASVVGGMVLGTFLFLAFAFQTFALTYTYSSTVAFITGLNVVIVPFLVYVLFKKRTTVYSVFGALVAAVGLYLLSAQGEIGLGIGEVYALVCAVLFALQISCTAYYVKHCNIYVLVVVQFAVVTFLSFVGALVFDGQLLPAAFEGIFLEAIIITAVFATVFAFFVQTAMQRFTTPAKTAIIFTMEPVSAGIAGYLWVNEVLNAAQLTGAALILVGILTAELGTYLRTKRETKKAMF